MNPGSPPTSDGHGRGGRRNMAPIIPRHRFEGTTDELKGQILDLVGVHSADLFIKSKKALANYIGRTYQHSGDIRRTIEALSVPTISNTNSTHREPHTTSPRCNL